MLGTDEEILQLSAQEMLAIIRRLERRIAEQGVQLAEFIKEVAMLREMIRESHRSKAPFSKSSGKRHPKKPGRHAGKGKFTQRPEPVATPADETLNIDMPLDVDQRQCPKCQTPLDTTNEQISVEHAARAAPRDQALQRRGRTLPALRLSGARQAS